MSKRTTEIVVAEDTNQPPPPPPPPPPKQPQLQLPNIQLPNLLSSFHNFKFRFPPFLIPPKPKRADSPNNNNNVAVSDADDQVAASGGGRGKRNVVRFPKAQVVAVPPPRLEVEAEESTTKTSNPFILWQVYAIGLFFVAKWGHSRWNERKGRGKSPNDGDRDE